MKHLILLLAFAAAGALAQDKPVADDKRQATVIPQKPLVDLKPKPATPAVRGEYLYVWEDTEGGQHRDIVRATGRSAPGECEADTLYEVKSATYTHWVNISELRRIKK